MPIHNPILPGFYPDPSVCRVGRDYYLVTSSFEYFPGVPIFHSRDLVNWRQIGHCLTRKNQLNLEQRPASAGIYAPTIRHHQGAFYMITTNVGGIGNFYVTAQDPAGPWSDPVMVDAEVFDPSLFFDEDGKVYYTRRGWPGILQAEIDIQTGRLLTPLRRIVDHFICPDIEGPHLYKIHGAYYLMAAEGGTRFGHCEVIGRSVSPWGPFEPCPHNPILTHRDQGHTPIRDLGHAELVEDPQGNWWLFCLGTRHRQYLSASILGRETFLAPVHWVEGWPLVGAGDPRLVSAEFESDLLPAQQPRPAVWRDDFENARLDFAWNLLRNPNEGDWSLSARPGHLRLHGSAVSLDENASPAFVGRRQQDFEMQARCLLEFNPVSENEAAGLTVYMHPFYHYDLIVALRAGQRCAVVRKQVGDLAGGLADRLGIETSAWPLAPGPVRLQAACDGERYTFSISQGGKEIELASGIARFLSPEVASHSGFGSWTGVYLGMFASGQGKSCQEPADFDWFEYHYLRL